MAITTQLQNNTPFVNYYGAATRLQSRNIVVPPVISSVDFCYCSYECAYSEKVFGHLTENDWWKNDKNTFRYRRLVASDTVVIKLFKSGIEVATITDNTYGNYINGYGSSYTTEQQLYVVFTIDWQKVLIAFGGGSYSISTELTILGTATTQTSHKFQLNHYSDVAANGTVRIETIQNGNIIGSPFDFTGLNLYNSFRIPAKFTETSPKLESDRYLNRDYKLNQIQDTVTPQYILKTKRIDRATGLMITRDCILANKVEVTDYNIINIDVFRRVEVYPESIDQADLGNTTRAAYEIPFTDKYNDLRKRNN